MDHQYQDFVIVGGGVAGLSAANYLADCNAEATLIEAGTYPTHKVCGEFLASEALSILEAWGIFPHSTFDKACFFSGTSRLNFSFPALVGSMPRYHLDTQLAKRAQSKGISILTGEKVLHLEKGAVYTLHLSSGRKISTKKLFLGTGKIPSKELPAATYSIRYIGIKAHFSYPMAKQRLEIHCFPHAYVGIAPISNDQVNIACLAKKQAVGSFSAKDYMQHLLTLSSPSYFKEVLLKNHMLFSEWMYASVPKFSSKNNPLWDNVYFIGDAAGGIPPVTGSGLAIGITSGCMAAKFALDEDADGFRKAWKDRYLSRIRWGKYLHAMMLNPSLSQTALKFCRYFPGIADTVFSHIREHPINIP